MASSIISTTIDETYPVAGQDNDSQGFRDNFTIIKDNFTFAKSEIETLQSDTAKLNVDNDYNDNTQSRLNLKEYTVQSFDGNGAVDSDYDFTNGQFVKFQAQGNLTFNITNWPTTTQYAEIIIALFGNGSAHNVTITSSFNAPGNSQMLTDGSTEIAGGVVATSAVTTTSRLIKAFTYDNGANVFLQYLGEYSEV